jgi:protocatechuate 3,4-dioxygenase beta subunit
MRHAVRSVLPLFILLFAWPSLAAISGTVMNADGAAISGAKVSIYAFESADARRVRLASPTPQRKALATATSDANGAFRIEAPKEQRFVDLRVDAAGYAPDDVWTAADDEAGALVLTKAPAKTGTITAGGKPVANATVVWGGGNGAEFTAVTDDKGHYSVPDPSKWAMLVVVLHPDFAPLNDVMLRDNTRMSPDRALQPGVRITGKVANDDGTPAAGAELFIDGWPAGKTADDGTFTVAHAKKDWQDLQAILGAKIARRPHSDAAVALKLAKGSTLAGTIVDAKTKQPVADAIVRLMTAGFGLPGGETPHTAVTDAKGNYSFTNVVSGNFQLLVERPGYSVPRAEVALLPGRAAQKPLYGTPLGTVAGTVVDEDKRPVAAAHISTRAGSREAISMITFGRMGGRSTYSGPDGRFVARNVSTEADVIVDAAKKGYPSAHTLAFRVNPGEKKSGVTLTIPRGIAFSGRVLDKNNKPVAGAAVELSESSGDMMGGMRRILAFGQNRGGDDVVRSAADGTFTVRAKEGRYDVAVKAEGYAAKTLRAQSITAATKPVDIVLDPGVEVTGRVTRGGVGLDNVIVGTMSMTEGPQTTTTGADGSFRLTDLSPGQLMLVINKQDAFIQEMRTVTAPAKDVIIDLPPGGRITGHVVDKASHQPVTQFQAGVSTARGGGGMVIQTPPMLKSFNSDDGSFTLDNIKPGSTQVVVNAPGYTSGRASNIEVEEGKTAPEVTVELDTGVKLTGKVTGPDGTPISGVTVAQDQSMRGGRVMRFDGMNSTVVTDPNGEYTIEALEPGEKTFNYSRSGYVTESRTVNLTGKEVRTDVQLSSGLRVSGQVVTDGGAPVPEAVVRASSASDSGFGREARTDSNGGFTLEGLAPGHYTFSASKNGYATGISRDVDIASGALVRVTMKSGGVISGHVTGLTAEELQQATVTAFGSGTGSASAPVDAGGNYRIEGAPTGSVRVSARVGGPMFAGSSKNSEPKTVVLDPGGSATADIEFKSNTVVRGRITRGGVAMHNASVMFFPKNGRTQTSATTTADANGVYEITGLADGPYNVQVVDFDRLSPYATTFEVNGSGTFDIDIRVNSVRGKVLDATTSQPLENARVEMRGKDNSMMNARAAMTGPSGEFLIDSVPNGSYTLSADKEGFGNTLRDLQVADAVSDLELKLSPSAGITLNVVDGRDGRLLSANSSVVDMQGNAVGGMGGFRFGGTPEPIKLDLSPGSYRVTLTAQGYALKTVTVTSPSTQTVPMTPGGTLLIQSKSTSQLRARLVTGDGTFYGRVGMGGDGTFQLLASPAVTTLQNIAPGTFRLEVLDAGDHVLSATSVTVNEGVQTTVSI